MNNKDPKPVLRDDGTLSPTHYTSLPPLGQHVTTGAPKLLPEVVLPDNTRVLHRI